MNAYERGYLECQEDALRQISERANKYMNTVEDYYLHGLWMARDILSALSPKAAGRIKGTEIVDSSVPVPAAPDADPQVSQSEPQNRAYAPEPAESAPVFDDRYTCGASDMSNKEYAEMMEAKEACAERDAAARCVVVPLQLMERLVSYADESESGYVSGSDSDEKWLANRDAVVSEARNILKRGAERDGKP